MFLSIDDNYVHTCNSYLTRAVKCIINELFLYCNFEFSFLLLQFLNNVRDMAKKCLRRIETFYGLFVDVASASFIIHKPNCIIENNFYLLNLALIFPQ